MVFSVFISKAQLKGNLKLNIETGILRQGNLDRFGIFLNVEPKIKISENAFLGMRIGATINSHRLENLDSLKFELSSPGDNGVITIVPTIDYYFDRENYRPFVGFGIGAYIQAADIDVTRYATSISPSQTHTFNIKNLYGVLLRAGLESRRVRFGVEYNLITKAEISAPDNLKVGTISNSYFALSVGYVVGGEKQ